MSPWRGTALAVIVSTVMVLGGCGKEAAVVSDPAALRKAADSTLATLPGVTRIDLSTSATDESVDLAVVMDAESTVDQVGVAAEEAQTFSEENAAEIRWTTHLYVGEPTATSAADQLGGAPLQIEVYPAVHASASADARAAWAVVHIKGVHSVAIARGTPYVTTTSVKALASVLEKVRTSPLWTDGGSMQADNGRVRLMDAPERTTLAQLAAIVDTAEAHPTGEFWLEAAATGDRWPELYVNRVSESESTDIIRRFAAQTLRSVSDDDYQLEYTMRAYSDVDPNKQIDTTGVVGWG